jgi:hypothetical protein
VDPFGGLLVEERLSMSWMKETPSAHFDGHLTSSDKFIRFSTFEDASILKMTFGASCHPSG